MIHAMKQLVLLAILFVALLTAVIVKEASRPEAGTLREQVALQRLGAAAFSPGDVAQIEIAGPGGGVSFAIEKQGDIWVVEGAFRAPASAGNVERLIKAVADSRGELRIDDTAALADFDLTTERATTVVLRSAAGTALADFALGRSSGTQGAFVRPRTDGIRDGAYAVSQDLRGALGLPHTQPGAGEQAVPEATYFHDLNLPNLALDDTTRIELHTPNWDVVFEKAGSEWAAVEGAPDVPLRPSGVQGLVRTLGGALSATALVDPARRAELGLDDAPYRVTAVLADGTRRSAIAAADREGGKYYVRLDTEQDPDVVYECAKWAWESLLPPGSQIFEFSSLGVQNDGLGQVRIDGADEPFAMTRPSDSMQETWSITAPTWPLPPADTQLRSYVTLLNSVRPIDWYAGKAPFEESAVVSYGPGAASVDELTLLRIGQKAPAGNGRLAILANAPERVIVLSDSVVARLLPDLMMLFDERPLSGAVPADVTGVTVREIDADGARSELFALTRGADGTWMVRTGGDDSPADDNAVASWLDDLLRLEVTERADDEGAAPAGREIEIRRGDEALTIGVVPATDGERQVLLGGTRFTTDTAIEVPDASSLVAADEGGENPGAGDDAGDGDRGTDNDDGGE